jgi:nicotinamide phosphoribosyltransferase
MRFYPEGTTKIYSYLCARSKKKSEYAVFFGLQYYLKEYLSKPITQADAAEFLEYHSMILGPAPQETVDKITALATLGYLPIEIKAVPEGTVIDNQNVLATVTNTHPDFAWVVGFFESLLLKVWNTTTVATLSHKFKKLVVERAAKTSDSEFLVPFLVHDFGYRGVSSEETAALSGAAHLVNFCGTDTVPAVKMLKEMYSGEGLIGASVPASEHSIMCSYGYENELEAFNAMMDKNPTGIVSIVSDTYNFWNVMTDFTSKLKDKILAREGKVVFRPDSGDPKLILCGDPTAPANSPERKGAIVLLAEQFGTTVNSKGYKELNPKVGLIYGDGMYYDRYVDILNTMENMGFASTNLVIGVGGLLLQQHNRDDLGFAFKATFAIVNGQERILFKDPITDSGKRSHKGLMMLEKVGDKYITRDQVTEDEEARGELETVFINGKILIETDLTTIRERAKV